MFPCFTSNVSLIIKNFLVIIKFNVYIFSIISLFSLNFIP